MRVLQRRTLALILVLLTLLGLLVYVALRSGPFAPVAVTATQVELRSLQPALFGIGTVESRYSYQIGPTAAGRVQRLDVQVGDRVHRGQVLGEMDPVDLDDRIRAQEAAYERAEAMLQETLARHAYASTQAKRYEDLYAARVTSEEMVTLKRQELRVTEATLRAAREDLVRIQAEHDALVAQRNHLHLVAPADGIVSLRNIDPGTTAVAGQTVLEIIDPDSFWVNVRFDQISTLNLAADLPARIVLRSRGAQALAGRVLRVEPRADTITEETLAKVVFNHPPIPLPPIGELAEITVDLPELPAMPVVPNAALQRQALQTGVWRITGGALEFVPVTTGRSDLEGHVQILEGLRHGDRIVLYSEKALTPNSRIRVVDRIPGV